MKWGENPYQGPYEEEVKAQWEMNRREWFRQNARSFAIDSFSITL